MESFLPSVIGTFMWDDGAGSAHEEPGIAPTSATAAPDVVWGIQAGAEEVLLVKDAQILQRRARKTSEAGGKRGSAHCNVEQWRKLIKERNETISGLHMLKRRIKVEKHLRISIF